MVGPVGTPLTPSAERSIRSVLTEAAMSRPRNYGLRCTQVSTGVTIILGLYDPPRNARTRERATNYHIVDPPPFPLCLL